MKAAGIRRYAAALGWETEVVPHEASRPKDISALLRRRRPVGCIVQCHFGRTDLSPRLFGATRVVYMDPDPALCGGRVAGIVDPRKVTKDEIGLMMAGERRDEEVG